MQPAVPPAQACGCKQLGGQLKIKSSEGQELKCRSCRKGTNKLPLAMHEKTAPWLHAKTGNNFSCSP